jgi:hypothetical protein
LDDIYFRETPCGKTIEIALIHVAYTNIGAFCLRMRENCSVRLQMADLLGGLEVVNFVMVFMKNMD